MTRNPTRQETRAGRHTGNVLVDNAVHGSTESRVTLMDAVMIARAAMAQDDDLRNWAISHCGTQTVMHIERPC